MCTRNGITENLLACEVKWIKYCVSCRQCPTVAHSYNTVHDRTYNPRSYVQYVLSVCLPVHVIVVPYHVSYFAVLSCYLNVLWFHLTSEGTCFIQSPLFIKVQRPYNFGFRFLDPFLQNYRWCGCGGLTWNLD